MKLVGVELVRVAVPFRTVVGTAAGVHRHREVLFVRVVTDEGEGWGECAAMSGASLVDPTVDDVATAANDRGAKRLVDASASRGGNLPGQAEVAPLFGSSPTDRMLAGAFEMAVADVELRGAGQSLAAALEVGEGFDAVRVGSAIGIPEARDLGVLVDEVAQAVEAGSVRVRLKIEPEWDIEAVRAVRSAYPNLVLHADANGSYTLDDVERLHRLEEFDLVCLEQPLPPADLVALGVLTRQLSVPVCLDESLTSPRRVLDALRNGACRVACLKPGRLGGLRATRAAHASCVEADVLVFVGGFFETGLGRSANLALAARLHQDAPGLVGDHSDPSTYLAIDPCGYPSVGQGWVHIPDQPGVGARPEEATLRELMPKRSWFPATYT